MKQGTRDILAAVFLSAAVPLMIFQILRRSLPGSSALPEEPQTEQQIQIPDTTALQAGAVSVLFPNEVVVSMSLEDYLVGVVLAEMPAHFESEALKAQAIVARTYTRKRMVSGGKHPYSAVCTDPSCCQAYTDPASYPRQTADTRDLEKVISAVKQTAGQVLTYNGQLIEATYFSCSGGRTEDAQAVWGAQIPYLQSVESPGEENAAHYVDTVVFSADAFWELLGEVPTPLTAGRIGPVTYTPGGGVATISICGREYTGTELRRMLGLRSTAFVITAAGDSVTVTTKGFGHRVGMSQYGAEAMAVTGSSAEQILSHYYPGTVLQLWQDD